MLDPKELKRPIFILGPGRSGTTLIRSLLAAHSRIAVTPETHFLARADQWGLSRGAPEDFETFWARYVSWLRFKDLGVDAGRCRELIEAQGEHSFQAVFRAVLTAFQEKAGKARIGEKTPGHSAFLPLLLEWFPDARILFTQRDPRAVVASQMKTFYVRKRLTPRSFKQGLIARKREQELIFYARDWVKNFQTYLPPWEDDERFHVVVYENLVQNTEAELRTLFDFLGEPFEPQVLESRREEAVPMPAARDSDSRMERWRQEHHNRSVAPVSADSLNKWKDELTQGEVALIEGCCAEAMKARGYTPSLPRRLLFAGRAAASVLSSSGTAELQARKLASSGRAGARGLRDGVHDTVAGLAARTVARGSVPSWFNYRNIQRETVQDYFERHDFAPAAGHYETVHPRKVALNPLPGNLSNAADLPDDRGWWGYSFRDVPQRISAETYIATLPNCLVSWYRNPRQGDDFYPAILNQDFHALDMRELRFRSPHGETLAKGTAPARMKKAVWITERVYHNHSHWLTAHLPKLLLLRERGILDQVLLPPERTAAMDGSLRMLGMDPESFPTWDPERPLFVEELTVVGTDRFRPELLRLVPAAFKVHEAPPAHRKVLISRSRASRRRLLNEDDLWARLEPQGFERVFMEDLGFEEQVALMRETSVLVAPHGAGLTNMLFCPSGTHVIEIADLSFPNPNFYAVAAAMGHDYWLVSADSVGDVHPLEKDLEVDCAAVSSILPRLEPVPRTARPSA